MVFLPARSISISRLSSLYLSRSLSLFLSLSRSLSRSVSRLCLNAPLSVQHSARGGPKCSFAFDVFRCTAGSDQWADV